MNRNGRRYSEEFKRGAVNFMVRNGMSANQMAQDFGLNSTTLSRWRRQYQSSDGQLVSPSVGALSFELTALQHKVTRLQEEVRILNDSIAIVD